MNRLLIVAICTVLVSASPRASSQVDSRFPTAKEIEAVLEAVLKKHDLPALGAALVTSRGLQAVSVVGVRKRGSEVKATIEDVWHLGSDGKAMTALLVARLVQMGKLSYDTPLVEVFPDLAATMHKDYRKVKLSQLLLHTAGLPTDIAYEKINRDLQLEEQRNEVAKVVLSKEPDVKPGSKFQYSNVGYILAGRAAELAGKATYETLMKQLVFDPLKMTTVGLGAAGEPGKVTQPFPHQKNGKAVSIRGGRGDNVPVMSPAGRYHCSLGDWAKFVAEELRYAQGKTGLLKKAGASQLFQIDADQSYTLGGWGISRGPAGVRLSHDGSNKLNFATAVLLPEKDLAVLVVCNQGGNQASEAARKVRQELVLLILGKSRKN